MSIAPILLPPNRPTPRPYRGGAAIERFRGLSASGDAWAPEDFLASTVTTFGSAVEGLTVIDGTPLRNLIAADPEGYLGARHVERFGADPRLLCKLLHTGERLFVHVHPDAAFARQYLDQPLGKTEAWIVIGVDEGVQAQAWLGFRREVSEAELSRWWDAQDSAAMLDAMHEVPLREGDVLFVPAGTTHSIGPGVLILELQEPADLSIILEHAPFERLRGVDPLLGLDAPTALGSVERAAWAPGTLASRLTRIPASGDLLPVGAESFFRAERDVIDGTSTWDARFAVVVITHGRGDLTWDGGSITVASGDVVLVPHGAGQVTLTGALTAIRCMPPAG